MHETSTRLAPRLGALEPASRALSGAERVRAYAELGKARLSAMAVAAVGVGYCVGGGGADAKIVPLLVGAGALSAASSFLNQFQEAEFDTLMSRTRVRPIPSGRISELEALATGLFLASIGALVLHHSVHPKALLVGMSILLGYNLAYTPLKRVSQLNTFVGAVVGALPVVLGAVAVRGQVSPPAQVLFAILFLWQLPHFWAIAWMHREDYRRGGYAMLSGRDQTGHISGLYCLLGVLLLFPVTLLPTMSGWTGAAYFCGAVFLGIGWIALAARFAWRPSDENARAVFRGSLVYLPALFLLMLVDKVGI